MQEVFAALRPLLARHADELSVSTDAADHFALSRPDAKGKAEFVASVQVRKSYVAFHLFPVYRRPELLQGMSAGLRARMQGKSCFNFKRVEPALFAELEALTAGALA